MRRHLLLCAAAVLPWMATFAPEHAQAQATRTRVQSVEPPKNVLNGGERPEFFGSATIFSDNRSQGFTSNEEDPAFQLDGGIIYKNFYFGVSGSSVDLGQFIRNDGALDDVGDISITYYGGYVNVWRGIDWDVSVTYTTYPGAEDANAELDYWEFSAGAAKVFFSDIKNGIRVYWSPDYTGDQGNNWIVELSTQKPLPEIRGWKPTLEFVSGYQFGEEDRGNFDYYYWEVGLEIQLNEDFSVDFRYHDTADVPFDCENLCSGRFTAAATLEF